MSLGSERGTLQPTPNRSPPRITLNTSLSMGQSLSKSHTAQPSPSTTARGITAAMAGGIRLKRAFAGRRKKSEGSAASTSSLPPAPPPKYEQKQEQHQQRASIIPLSPGISSAVDYMRRGEEQREREEAEARKKEEEAEAKRREKEANEAREGQEAQEKEDAQEKGKVKDTGDKDTWRKSDSTISHHTMRPGGRPSRPVSMAESLQSNHTIVPVNKRLSALVTDADFGMPEEDEASRSSLDSTPAVTPSTPPTNKNVNRRSMSLNIVSPTPPVMSPSRSKEAPSSIRTAAVATGFIAPSTAATGTNIRGRLEAWTAPPSNPYTTFPPPPPTPSRLERNLPALPSPSSSPSPSFRQTAISMTSSFAPAAGLAKRAVEKMGRVWGLSASVSSTSGYSSSSSSHTSHTPPSSYAGAPLSLTRTSSGQRKGKLRHTPHAPSVSSTASLSDADAFMNAPPGPVLGKMLRGPLRARGGGGVVFGRDLKTVVRETSVGVGKPRVWGGRWRNWDGDEGGAEEQEATEAESVRVRRASVRRGQLKALEERKLPALVVRCAQHLLIWGVQEEGLFRVSGRPSHVSKLRAEFDSGADFDMTGCTPGDLDPHAVASVFKAFLRELPEPILTNALLPFFEAAMAQESTTNASIDVSSRPRSNSRGPGLPSGPRTSNLPAIRKPPSLSTLAMPSFSGLRPPSATLIHTFQALLAQLPQENRDLIRTAAELIRATAKDSGDTKMPLSNLLLVFCPSLNMNPPLLRILCEAEDLWDGVPTDEDIAREVVLDIRASPELEKEEEEKFEDARDGTEDDAERDSVQSVTDRRSEDFPGSVEYNASSEDVARRQAGTTAYVDTDNTSTDDTSSLCQSTTRRPHNRSASLAASSLGDDGSSFLSTSEDQDVQSSHYADGHSQSLSPPLLTSSAESLNTPASSAGHASFPHLPLAPSKDELYNNEIPHSLHLQSSSGPIIAESSPMGLSPSTPRRPVISNPIPITGQIHFPLSAPDTAPSSPTKLEKRRSIPVLSLPSFSPSTIPPSFGQDPPGTHDTSSLLSIRGKRMKKPSLHLLFSKKSTSSLSSPKLVSSASIRPTISSPYLLTPHSASDSSVSTPLSAVTAPQSSTATLPPVLDTPIESSPLHFGLGIDVYETPATPATPDVMPHPVATSRPLPNLPSVAALASASVTSLAPGHTPIADQYQRTSSPSPSLASKSATSITRSASPLPDSPHLRPRYPMTRGRGTSTSSNASSNHLGIMEDEDPEEDWTRSVLLAADVDAEWVIEQRG